MKPPGGLPEPPGQIAGLAVQHELMAGVLDDRPEAPERGEIRQMEGEERPHFRSRTASERDQRNVGIRLAEGPHDSASRVAGALVENHRVEASEEGLRFPGRAGNLLRIDANDVEVFRGSAGGEGVEELKGLGHERELQAPTLPRSTT